MFTGSALPLPEAQLRLELPEKFPMNVDHSSYVIRHLRRDHLIIKKIHCVGYFTTTLETKKTAFRSR